jgi:maltooligosyltrehalose trehalohydrolase
VSFVLERGASPGPEGVRFRVWAPRAERVEVVVADGPEVRPLEPSSGGVFEGLVEGLSAGCDYRYRLDGGCERADPVSRHQPNGVAGPSRVVDPAGYVWRDEDWSGIERADLVIYELHVGTFSRAGSFAGIESRLAALSELGVTALELMPVAQFPGTRNWGYDGVFPYAVQHGYGGPEGLRHLVDAAHGAGLAVLLDVVYNHLGPEGNVLGDFGPYFTDRYRTPWGDALNFDGPDSDEVRRYFIDNALHWVTEYHMDGLRLDAVHAIRDAGARPFLGELARAFDALAHDRGRPLHLVAESDDNDPRLVRERSQGGLGLHAVWSDDFHHAVHAALTGERSGYYVDFGGVEPVAKAFRDRFVQDGGWSAHRRRRHGAAAGDLPGDRFVVCVQNHDQVGNRAFGERLSVLLEPPRQRLATSLLLLSPYLPLLFMGEEYGETAPFLYFVDHTDPALLRAVREGRRAEFASFGWRAEVPDPGSVETFERSRPVPERAREPAGVALLALHTCLLELRRREPALRPGDAAVSVRGEPGEGWFAASYRPRAASGRELLALFHFDPRKRVVDLEETGVGSFSLLFDSGDARFGGPGRSAPERLDPKAGSVHGLALPAESALLYARDL